MAMWTAFLITVSLSLVFSSPNDFRFMAAGSDWPSMSDMEEQSRDLQSQPRVKINPIRRAAKWMASRREVSSWVQSDTDHHTIYFLFCYIDGRFVHCKRTCFTNSGHPSLDPLMLLCLGRGRPCHDYNYQMSIPFLVLWESCPLKSTIECQ
jgi:hypothetical protein